MNAVSYLRPFAFEEIDVTDAAVQTLDPDVYYETSNEYPKRQVAREATISVEDQPIRFRIDGGNPDQDTGHYIPAGTFFTITNATSLINFKAVAVGSTVTAVLQVTYFNG